MPVLAASNQRIRRLRRLSGRRSARVDEGAFLLEGPVLIAEAFGCSFPIEGVYLDDASDDFDEVIHLAHVASVPVHRAAAGVLSDITDAVTPRPILAVAPIPNSDLASVIARTTNESRHLVVLVDVRDPGNVGTIARAAEASGASGIICCAGTADPWSPKVVRSSAGAVLHLPVVTGVEPRTVLDELHIAGIERLGTVVDVGEPYDRHQLGSAVAFVLGNEAHGLSDDLSSGIDLAITIPMVGRSESLNVAMAASILCFEALRQRRSTGLSVESLRQTDWTAAPTDDKVIRP